MLDLQFPNTRPPFILLNWCSYGGSLTTNSCAGVGHGEAPARRTSQAGSFAFTNPGLVPHTRFMTGSERSRCDIGWLAHHAPPRISLRSAAPQPCRIAPPSRAAQGRQAQRSSRATSATQAGGGPRISSPNSLAARPVKAASMKPLLRVLGTPSAGMRASCAPRKPARLGRTAMTSSSIK